MTEKMNGKPRHLDDITSAMPVINPGGKHGRPDTGELRRMPPRPSWVPPVPPPKHREPEEPVMKAQPEKRPWWKFWA